MIKIILFFLLFINLSFSQQYKITYIRSSNGSILEQQDPIVILTNTKNTLISSEAISQKKGSFPYEQTLIDRTTGYIHQFAYLNANRVIATIDSLGLSKQSFELLPETKKILGYTCKKAKTIVNSNTIELWYTEALKVKGAPGLLGQNLGLVLEFQRNGNFSITASSIEKINTFLLPDTNMRTVDMITYKDEIWKSRFTTISVFKDHIIHFSDEFVSNDSIWRFANGTVAVKKIKFPEIQLGSPIFVDVTEQSNGDAYDRTGSLFLIPTDKKHSFFEAMQEGWNTIPAYENGNGKKYQGVVATNDYSPIVELMRFFTPFGIKQYNYLELKNITWMDKVFYRQEISDLASLLNNKEVYIGIFIGNYDKGGHKVSANITIHPEEKRTIAKTIIPLFCTNNIMEMGGQEYGTMFDQEKGLIVTFRLEKGLKNCQLRYIATGHGGWENGDEFVPKLNRIILDGKEVFRFTPWRQDCGSYRQYNPASGNFSNGLSSSDYSRANWCPGTVTPPIYIDLGDIAEGEHTIQVKIPQGLPEGNSFSSWNISGVLIGD